VGQAGLLFQLAKSMLSHVTVPPNISDSTFCQLLNQQLAGRALRGTMGADAAHWICELVAPPEVGLACPDSAACFVLAQLARAASCRVHCTVSITIEGHLRRGHVSCSHDYERTPPLLQLTGLVGARLVGHLQWGGAECSTLRPHVHTLVASVTSVSAAVHWDTHLAQHKRRCCV
jgi:hypothetical protein